MFKKISTVSFFIIIAVSAGSCSRWYVNSLSSKKVTEIKSGEGPGQVQIIRDEYTLNELSFRLEVYDDKIIAADNSLKRLQVLDSNGNPELIIGSLSNIDKTKYKTFSFNFGSIGTFTRDDDENLYVQNRLETRSVKSDNEGGNFTPSYILVFNSNGELVYTMGKTGTPEFPFFYIEKLFVDSEGRLFVISRTFNSWEIFRFNKRKREKYIDFSKLEFKETEDNNTYNGKIENIRIFKSGDEILLSVAYYHDVRFKYRKLYIFSLDKDKLLREVGTFPDPKNVLFNIVDDKIIYFWNIEGKDIKFMLVNMDGNIVNNVRVEFDTSSIFTKIITDESGVIHSYHVHNDTLQVLQWE
jgi:hypothetical protein